MFLTIDDYRVVTCPQDLDILMQSDDSIRAQAEQTAMEEIAGYARSRYDIDKAFAMSGTGRNAFLVQMTVSISLYYMSLWLPQFMAYEKYQTLYENFIERLKAVQKGTFTIALPEYESDDGAVNGPGDAMIFGSMKKQTYDY